MPRMKHPPTTRAVLKRAAALIASPLPHEWAACEYNLGPYCLRCAAARATTELTRKMHFYAGDAALENAVFEMKVAEGQGLVKALTQQQAHDIIQKTLEHRATWGTR